LKDRSADSHGDFIVLSCVGADENDRFLRGLCSFLQRHRW
jgi:hypothetical protein